MKNIHLLPTDKPSRLHFTEFEEILVFTPKYEKLDGVNIYITSDEEIKEGDWFYNTVSLKPEPFKACENGDGYVNCSKYSHYRIDCKKIILTTDQDLIKDGVQAIDDEFLEWFVKNPSCDFVEVERKTIIEYEPIGHAGGVYKYKTIIPKEEPKQECKGSFKDCFNPLNECVCDSTKQETLEEFAKKSVEIYVNEREKQTAYLEIIRGAKWQQQQNKNLYSDGEVEYLLYSFKNYLGFGEEVNEKKWFEQFSKLKNG